MPSESSKKMRDAYEGLLEVTEKVYEMTPIVERRLQAELEIKTGLGANRVKRMIENMVLTGRLLRIPDKDSKKAIPKQEEDVVDQLLSARPAKEKKK